MCFVLQGPADLLHSIAVEPAIRSRPDADYESAKYHRGDGHQLRFVLPNPRRCRPHEAEHQNSDCNPIREKHGFVPLDSHVANNCT